MPRLIALPLVLAAATFTASSLPMLPFPVPHQDSLARRVSAVGSGSVRFSFKARSGVCGDGRTFIAERDPSGRGYNQYYSSGSFDASGWSDSMTRCVPGNAYVVLDVRRGDVTRAQTFVGPLRVSASTDLGMVEPQEAADYLLNLGRRGGDITSTAFLGAGIADGARITSTTLRYAREPNLDPDVRESALKWSARAAQREGTTQQVIETARSVAQTERDPLDVRERAIRVLGEMPGGGTIVRGLYATLDETQLRERAVRVVAEVSDAQAAPWLRTIFLDQNEQNDVRDRAVRVLAELGYTSELRTSFDRVNNEELQDRIVRVVSENGSRADLEWTEQVARNPRVASDVRDRAVRVLAEAGVSSERLGRLYDQVEDVDVQDRLLRLLGERGDAQAIAKLNQVARNDGNPDLRERAVRSLGKAPARK